MITSRLARLLRLRAFVPLLAALAGLAFLPHAARAQAALQTLTIYGTDAALGTIDPNTDCSRDGGATWLPAYAIWHPWGQLGGTTSWIGRNTSGGSDPNVNDFNPEYLDFRIRFYAPADISGAQLTYYLNADNYGDIFLNGAQVNASQIIGNDGVVGSATITNANIVAGLNTILVRLKDTGGLLGINYRIDVQGYGSSAFQRLVAPPSAMSASSTLAADTYKAGTLVPVRVQFSRAVSVTGMPTLTLETGATDRVATYASGSGTDTLTFNYTVQAGDASSDLDYVSTAALALAGGSIKSSGSDAQDANLTLPAPGADGSLSFNNDIGIDGVGPKILGIARLLPSGPFTNSTQVTFRITFSEAVSGVDAADFRVQTTSSTGLTATLASITPVADTFFYDVVVNQIAGNGTLLVAQAASSTITDLAGNPLASSSYSLQTYSVDQIAPTVVLSSAGPNPTNAAIPIAITFSENVTGFIASDLSISGGTVSGFTGSGTSYSATVNPTQQGTITISLPAGRAQDTAGNLTAAATPLTRVFDNAAPDTSFTATPSPVANSTSATFSFTGTDTGSGVASFEGSLDNATYAPVASPVTLSGLSAGSHTYRVRAKDATNNIDPTPATYTWTVDVTAPLVSSIFRLSPATSPTNSDTLQFRVAFSKIVVGVDASDFVVSGTTAGVSVAVVNGATYDVTLAGGNLAALNGTVTLGFAANQNIADLAGNALVNTTPTGTNNNTFVVVNNTAPTNLALAPASINQSATFTSGATVGTFSTTDADAGDTFTYSLVSGVDGADNTNFTIAGSTLKSLIGMIPDTFHIRVRTTDAGGLSFEKALTVTVVDDIAPNTSISSGPASLGNATSATFAFTATEAGSTFEASLDGGAFATVTSPQTYSGLADGAHTFSIRAKDAAGNADATPASYSWTIDTVAPVITAPTSPILVEATSASGVAVNFTVTATDNISGAITPVLSKASGSLFAPGMTTVTATATDAAGNVATKSFNVVVRYITLTEDKTVVTVAEGGTATNAGTFGEKNGAAVTLTQDRPGATLTQTSNGQWTFQQMLSPGGSPIELVLDTQENLYVVSEAEVVKYDPTGAVLTRWAVAGTPTGIAIDTANSWLYVALRDGNAVQKYTLGGTLLLTITNATNGGFSQPHCVATDASGTVYVTDSGHARVQVFDSTGTFLREWGGGGSADGQFNFPQGIRITPSGTVYIADRNNHRVQYFTTAGTFLGQWGSFGSGNSQFSQPAGVGIDPSGNVYVGDLGNNRVQKFSATGAYLDQVGSGSGDAELAYPHGTAFPPAGRSVYVASWANGHVVKYLTPGAWSWSYAAPLGSVGTSTVTITANDGVGTATQTFTLVVTDATAPRIASIVRQSPTTSPTAQDTITFRVTFSEAVTGVDATDFTVSGTTATASVATINATTYDVTLSGGNLAALNGTITLGLAAAQNIKDSAGNALTNTAPTGTNNNSFVLLNNLAPTDIALTPATINQSATFSLPATVGTLSTSDPDAGDTFTYALVAGAGGADNTNFAITGATLKATLGLMPDVFRLRVRTTDAGGLSFEKALTVTVLDDIAPNTTISSAPVALTGSTSATFTFTSTEAGTFQAQLDGGAFAPVTSPATVTGLSHGPHTFNVRAVDAAGNTDATPASYTWTVDTIAPDTTIVSQPASVTNSTSASFTFTANEAGATFAVSIDGGAFQPAASPHSLSGLADGPHTFAVRATDAVGNTDATPASYTWTIDTQPPTIAIATIAGDDRLNAVEAAAALTISGTTSGAENGRTVTVAVGNQALSASVFNSAWSVALSASATSALAEQTHTVTANVSDAAGNPATTATRALLVDKTAPAAPVVAGVSDDTGSSANDGITNDTTLIVRGTAEALSSVEVFKGGASIGRATANAAGAWSFDYAGTTLGNGEHAFTAQATDAAGNTGATSGAFVATVDTAIATPVIASISNDSGRSATDGITNDNTLGLAGTAEPLSTVTITRSGAGVIGTAVANATGAWSFDASATTLADGTYLFTARATDTAGNTSAASADFPVMIDTAAPTIAAASVSGTYRAAFSHTVVANESSVTFTATGLPAGLSLNAATGEISGAPTDSGTFTIALTATDAAGNTGNGSLTISLAKVNLTIAGVTAADRVYDATTNAQLNFSGASLVGVLSGDNVSLNSSAAVGTFADKRVGTAKTVAIAGLSLTGTHATHYTFTAPTATATITPRALTVAGATAANKVYDGNTVATLGFVSATLLNVAGADAVTLVSSGATGAFANANVGVAKTVTVSGLTLTGADASNYTLTPPTLSADIAVRPITVAAAAKTKVYGTSDPALTYMITSGSLVTGESFTGALTRVAGENVGTYAIGRGTLALSANCALTFQPALLTITPAAATIAFGDLTQPYDGQPKPVAITTAPVANLATSLTYNGSATAPTLPGAYTVVATITNPNYSGSATDTLLITVTSLVRHAPSLNGDIDGSLQVLLPESVTLNGGAMISGDLLVPGTPTVRLNGNPTFAGTIDSSGAANPSTHQVTLNGNGVLRKLVRRVDALTLATVAAPPAPTGSRSVTMNKATDAIGEWATLRNLTLNGNSIVVTVPPGTYGNLNANGSNSGFALGIAGSSTRAVYNLQSLTLNGNTTLRIVGPVTITLANGVQLNGDVGDMVHPEWLTLRVASGDVTLNGNVDFAGDVIAPNGQITINGNSTLKGHISADRLTVNGNALLADPEAP